MYGMYLRVLALVARHVLLAVDLRVCFYFCVRQAIDRYIYIYMHKYTYMHMYICMYMCIRQYM